MQVTANTLNYLSTINANAITNNMQFYLRGSIKLRTTISIRSIIGAAIPLSSTNYNSVTALYNGTTTKLNNAIISQQYTTLLQSYNTTNTADATVINIPTYSDPIVVSSNSDTSRSIPPLLYSVISILPALLLLIMLFLVHILRNNKYNDKISQLKSLAGEITEIDLYCVTWYFFINTILEIGFSEVNCTILLISKLPIIVTWIAIMIMLIFPNFCRQKSLRDYLFTPVFLNCTLANIPDSTFYGISFYFYYWI
jgi:hypothetical protein